MLHEHLSDSNVVLIPKNNSPTTLNDFRPISLANVIYKVIAKTLANRLKPLLSKIISVEQVAFVKGWSIVDNVLFAFELLHYMKTKHSGKMRDVTLKIDISKAYDRVD